MAEEEFNEFNEEMFKETTTTTNVPVVSQFSLGVGMTVQGHYTYSNTVDVFGYLERLGVEEWQREIFAPHEAHQRMETVDLKVVPTIQYGDYIEDAFTCSAEFFASTESHYGYGHLENLYVVREGQVLCILDVVMHRREKNPLLTNMSLDESIPEEPGPITVEGVNRLLNGVTAQENSDGDNTSK